MSLTLALSLAPTWLKHAQWRRPDSRVEQMFSLGFYADLAREADLGGVDAIFLPDTVQLDTAPLEQFGGFSRPDGLVLAAALAAVTEHVRLVPTVHAAFDEPYATARRIQSLHQLSGGRAGWNVVAGLGGRENFAHRCPEDGAPAYARTDEFIDVVRALWAGYPADALVLDRAEGRFADASRVRPINHLGKAFQVAGPINVPARPGREPMLFQAGGSADWIALAARTADAVFIAAPDLETAVRTRTDLHRAAERIDRDPAGIRVLPGLDLCLAPTTHQAEQIRTAGGGATAGYPRWQFTGTPDDAAAEIDRWARAGALDGIVALPTGWTGSVTSFARDVAPALSGPPVKAD